jgi:hypothetical protein
MTHTGFPDPRYDLVCITSIRPRQFPQFASSCFASLNCCCFNVTTIALPMTQSGAVHSIINCRVGC